MRVFFAIIALLWSFVAMAQPAAPLGKAERVCNVDDLLPHHIEVKGSTQGFAIHGNYAFSMHDGGECVILDIKRRRYVNHFAVEGNTGHCNNASFGLEYYSKESAFPLFYVSECRGQRACYVNDITLHGSRLVQKIFYSGDEINGPCDWAVDAERGLLYLYCTIGRCRCTSTLKMHLALSLREILKYHKAATLRATTYFWPREFRHATQH